MAFSMAIDASVESNLKISPPGPVVVLNSSLIREMFHGKEYYMIDENFERTIITCRSTGNYNITWDIPEFNYAELSEHMVILIVSCLTLNIKVTKKKL